MLEITQLENLNGGDSCDDASIIEAGLGVIGLVAGIAVLGLATGGIGYLVASGIAISTGVAGTGISVGSAIVC